MIKKVVMSFWLKTIVFWGTGKNRYQMEVPDRIQVPDEFELTSSRKGFKRYRTKQIESLLEELTSAEQRKEAALKDIMRRIFNQFDSRYSYSFLQHVS